MKIYLPNKYKKQPSCTKDCSFELLEELTKLFVGVDDAVEGDSTWGGITGTLSDQTDLQNALNLKANLISPALTGSPTAPTQLSDDNSTKIATTAYVDAANVAVGDAAINSSYLLRNLGLAASVATNALTISLKQANAVTDPAADFGGIDIGFRKSSALQGGFDIESVTAALSIVISNGSTLGHKSGINEFIYVYALDNAGTVELAVSSELFDEGSLVSTTAEGGAGGADSGTIMYSTTARANIPFRLIGRLTINEATAGAWATAPSEISLIPFNIPVLETVAIPCSDLTTDLTTGTFKGYIRIPYAFRIIGSGVSASVKTAPTGATLLTVDINEDGVSILSTKLTFDASEKTTSTATTAAVISDYSIAAFAEISCDIDAVGSTIAGQGLIVYLRGYRV